MSNSDLSDLFPDVHSLRTHLDNLVSNSDLCDLSDLLSMPLAPEPPWTIAQKPHAQIP